MFSGRNAVDWRVLGAVLIFFGACGYDPPAVESGSTSSSSSSSGKGGAGAGEQSSSSSSGDGGVGGLGVGGAGGTSVASVASSSSSSGNGGMGGGMTSSNIDCAGIQCDTSGQTVCCFPPVMGVPGLCDFSGKCLAGGYKLKCDDKADCGKAGFCCFDGSASSCNAQCAPGQTLCRTNDDCPMGQSCPTMAPFPKYCQ